MDSSIGEIKKMKTIVVSGINLFRGGTLKVMQDCIASLSAFAGTDYTIIALVHDENQYPEYENVKYLSYPKSRKSYLFRLYYEYIEFKKLSKKLKPYFWLSMHDVTPNVIAEKRAVYCHNPFPFYKAGIRGLFLQKSIYLFSLFSKFMYRINIKKNDYVVVQQEWMRKTFKQMFSIDNVIVALPYTDCEPIRMKEKIKSENDKYIFFYPMTPMIHKNIEVIGEAVSILEKEGFTGFEVVLTTDGTENKYAKSLLKKYGSLKALRFAGFLKREEMDRCYRQSDCLLFPSKVETWGLPVMEAKEYAMSIIVSDFPYAKETVGKYDKVKFFDSDNAEELADDMKKVISGQLVYDQTEEIIYEKSFARNWNELIRLLFLTSND
jgi:glycosyltransferase involved in cell wall biosynthesis